MLIPARSLTTCLMAVTLSLPFVACPSVEVLPDPEPAPTPEATPDPIEEDGLTCEECHIDLDMLIETVEEPEEPDPENESTGEG